jgi:hypothetical protein
MFLLKLPRRVKMTVALIFIALFVFAGIAIIADDGKWNRRNK